MRKFNPTPLIFLCCLFLASNALAAAAVEVVKNEGQLSIRAERSGNGPSTPSSGILSGKNILVASGNGRAVVRIANVGYIVLEKNSSVEIGNSQNHASFFRHLTGVIYYAINTIKNQSRLVEVRTKSASLGIRGTRFLVFDMNEKIGIGMRKGTVKVLSEMKKFEIHRTIELNEFKAFREEGIKSLNREKKAFNDYKNSTQDEFVEYRQEFFLKANRMVSIDREQRVDELPLGGEIQTKMESLEHYSEYYLNQVLD
ncbi:MAG: FecR domain-containing protein [Gallionella sp.]|nr:FecR domain-containing protein [Gallionella sp.]PIR10194.1 MAG: hypothetical protein COV51_00535 [Gallionellaceae bacterium CG11_big_fil_rev_8_21_14_0_20_60_62]